MNTLLRMLAFFHGAAGVGAGIYFASLGFSSDGTKFAACSALGEYSQAWTQCLDTFSRFSVAQSGQWWALAIAAVLEGGTMVAVLLTLAELLERPSHYAGPAVHAAPGDSDSQRQLETA